MKLNKKRNLIDEIDKKIAMLLNERFIVVEEIKEIKQQQNIPITDLKREREVIDKNKKYINERFYKQYEEIYKTLLDASKEIQNLWAIMV